MRSSSEFSEGSFNLIIYGKLLRFNVMESQYRAASNVRMHIGQDTASYEYCQWNIASTL